MVQQKNERRLWECWLPSAMILTLIVETHVSHVLAWRHIL